jgi:putative salt-induced outer membrane protein YdiY
MMYKTFIAMVIVLVWFAAPLAADEVYLVNGDRITGKIKTMGDGKLTIESDLAGKLTVDMNNVTTFKSNEPIEIQLKDGTGFKKQVEKAETGKFAIESDQTLKAQDFNVASITIINPPPKEEPKWHGDISGALVKTTGNTSTENRNASFNLNKRTDNDRSLLSGEYNYGKQKDPSTGEQTVSQDNWKLHGKYDYFFTKKAFGFLDGRYEKDRIAELQRRVVIGAGAGYQWVESKPFNFSTEAGIASRYENYTNDTPSSSQLSVQLGYHLDKELTKVLTFINDLTYYPSLENSSDYLLMTTGELRAKITEKFFTNFKVEFDYDSTPAEGKGTTDLKYILGVGMSF